MWSSRKSSVKRHIHNLHHDNSMIVKFIDYLAGRHVGLYSPSSAPEFEKSYFNYIADVFTEEYLREKARILAQKHFK